MLSYLFTLYFSLTFSISLQVVVTFVFLYFFSLAWFNERVRKKKRGFQKEDEEMRKVNKMKFIVVQHIAYIHSLKVKNPFIQHSFRK